MIRMASFLAGNARPVLEQIARFVGERIGQPAELIGGIAWEEQHRLLDRGEIDVAFICGLPYTEKHDRPDAPIDVLAAPVMQPARYQGRPIYFTDVIVRQESPFHSFADLRGCVWAYNDPGSHSGYNVVRHHLITLGETSGYFGRVVASGGHQRSIQLVVEGAVDASGVDSTVLDLEMKQHPELADRIRIVESIGPSPIPPVVVAHRLPAATKQQIRDTLLQMHKDPTGQAILNEGLIAHFVAVADADYDPIRAMARRARAVGYLVIR
jgi:phosphonate transport system substrate-binding protein